MKFKIAYFILILCWALPSNGQTSIRSEKIHNNALMKEYLSAHRVYNDTSNELMSVVIDFQGKDMRYPHILEMMTVFQGSPEDFHAYLIAIEAFYAKNKNDSDVSMRIQGHLVSYKKELSMPILYLYERAGFGYHPFTPKRLAKYKARFEKWFSGGTFFNEIRY